MPGWSSRGNLVVTQARGRLCGWRGQSEPASVSVIVFRVLTLHQVDEEGRLTGPEVAYIYPDCLTVLLGQFSDGQMVAGREHRLSGLLEDERGVKVPTFQRSDSPDHLHLHRRQIGRYDYICDGSSSLISLFILPPSQSQIPPLQIPTRGGTSQSSSPG